ncbi:MAG: K(+)-transporting ATPase subunit F [Sphingomicrobium sp.]
MAAAGAGGTDHAVGRAPFFVRGWASLETRHLSMFTLISLGLGAAFLYSLVATLAPGIFPETFKMHGVVLVGIETIGGIAEEDLLRPVASVEARSLPSQPKLSPMWSRLLGRGLLAKFHESFTPAAAEPHGIVTAASHISTPTGRLCGRLGIIDAPHDFTDCYPANRGRCADRRCDAHPSERLMSIDLILGGLTALGLLIYLTAVLLRPERF